MLTRQPRPVSNQKRTASPPHLSAFTQGDFLSYARFGHCQPGTTTRPRSTSSLSSEASTAHHPSPRSSLVAVACGRHGSHTHSPSKPTHTDTRSWANHLHTTTTGNSRHQTSTTSEYTLSSHPHHLIPFPSSFLDPTTLTLSAKKQILREILSTFIHNGSVGISLSLSLVSSFPLSSLRSGRWLHLFLNEGMNQGCVWDVRWWLLAGSGGWLVVVRACVRVRAG